jgi:hypothetical protein
MSTILHTNITVTFLRIILVNSKFVCKSSFNRNDVRTDSVQDTEYQIPTLNRHYIGHVVYRLQRKSLYSILKKRVHFQ